MSADKLMKRIVNPELDNSVDTETAVNEKVYHMTYGIAADPLLQFSVVFSALIHDCDHTGLSNGELAQMDAPVSMQYSNKSPAEQNSVNIAWSLLIADRYASLRSCIYANEQEFSRFRKLIVNAVIATDIADKELKSRRESRWEIAFAKDPAKGLTESKEEMDRKATIVFEYIIQASDVCHTMQHWRTYQRWNERLFEERYLAWVNGRAEKEPSLGWYKGELWFFDNYIIPMAQKLNKCGVFGVSYHEYLQYAIQNRREWEEKGMEIVPKLLSACQAKYGCFVNQDGKDPQDAC